MSALPQPRARRCRGRPTTARRRNVGSSSRCGGFGIWALSVGLYDTSHMYSVTKRLDFCYGHRLLDYEGICRHPHGHNAVVEIEIRTDTLDPRNMVADFS